MQKILSIVCPFYNEEDSVQGFFDECLPIIEKSCLQRNMHYEFICVDDGSSDKTLELLQELKKKIPTIRVVSLSRNFGKEAALSAGLDYAKGDAIIPIDADLQDPPELIEPMLCEWEKGFDVVLARRVNRSTDSWLKRTSAKWFYKLHNHISDIQIPDQVGDFRLIDKKVLSIIKTLPESQRFMKGIFAWVGFKSSTINYKRGTRTQGHTKFNIWKLWNFALDGITGYSTILLKIWTYLGLLVSVIAFVYGSIIISKAIFLGVDAPGYASLMSVILFLGGVNMIGLGILGEYIGRIYLESKNRPVYVVEKEY